MILGGSLIRFFTHAMYKCCSIVLENITAPQVYSIQLYFRDTRIACTADTWVIFNVRMLSAPLFMTAWTAPLYLPCVTTGIVWFLLIVWGIADDWGR